MDSIKYDLYLYLNQRHDHKSALHICPCIYTQMYSRLFPNEQARGDEVRLKVSRLTVVSIHAYYIHTKSVTNDLRERSEVHVHLSSQ